MSDKTRPARDPNAAPQVDIESLTKPDERSPEPAGAAPAQTNAIPEGEPPGAFDVGRWKPVAPAQGADHPATDKCGFDRNASHSAGVYVCACGWTQSNAAPQESNGRGNTRACEADKTVSVPAVAAPAHRVVCAANRNQRTGLIICGARHFDNIMYRQMEARPAEERDDWRMSEQGFIDQRGNFMTREQALALALKTGQRIYRFGGDEKELFSENLY